MLANGGFDYHCFHASCDYNQSTGWQPSSSSRHVGKRVIKLYRLLGGDPADLIPHKRLPGYVSLAEMLADFGIGSGVAQ